MTENPEWGLDIVRVLLDAMEERFQQSGLKSALRVTPNDNREMVRPPRMRSGRHWDSTLKLFEGAAAAGAELLSIESTGGKEVHDEALLMCDLHQVVFALCVMGARDMEFLWKAIVEIASRHGVHCAGDTACGFHNTAMVLAEQGMIPRLFAAVVRAVTAVRSLVAYEFGAVGPGKDCGYENPILKAITGFPMSMEGKSAACAHLSPLGNIAAVAEGDASARRLRDWLVVSDARLDPQAYILRPESVIPLARVVVQAESSYLAGKAVAREAIRILREGHEQGMLQVATREVPWLDRLERSADALSDDESAFIADQMAYADRSRFVAGACDPDED